MMQTNFRISPWLSTYKYDVLVFVYSQVPEIKQPSGTKAESPEGYYEEAEPYGISTNGTELFTYMLHGRTWSMSIWF